MIPTSDQAVVRAERASKHYGADEARVEALRDISLDARRGEFIALTGRSGCGKTTLLNLLGAMDQPSSGAIWLGGEPTAALDDDTLTRLRGREVGFVFQAFHLLPTLTLEENLALPLWLQSRAKLTEEARGARVALWLERIGLASRRGAYPHQLSGGEMQRVAIARALIHEPALVIADEPTGNLDSQTAGVILDLLQRLALESGAAVVMATHSAEAARRATRVLHLTDGRLT